MANWQPVQTAIMYTGLAIQVPLQQPTIITNYHYKQSYNLKCMAKPSV